MHRFFRPPIFEDEEKTNTARLLHLILYILLPSLTLVGILTMLALPQNAPRWIENKFQQHGDDQRNTSGEIKIDTDRLPTRNKMGIIALL